MCFYIKNCDKNRLLKHRADLLLQSVEKWIVLGRLLHSVHMLPTEPDDITK